MAQKLFTKMLSCVNNLQLYGPHQSIYLLQQAFLLATSKTLGVLVGGFSFLLIEELRKELLISSKVLQVCSNLKGDAVVLGLFC